MRQDVRRMPAASLYCVMCGQWKATVPEVIQCEAGDRKVEAAKGKAQS